MESKLLLISQSTFSLIDVALILLLENLANAFLLIYVCNCVCPTDPRVMYSEPAKFVAKLREMKTDNNLLLFKCELGAGHFSKSGRYERSLNITNTSVCTGLELCSN